MTTFTEGMPVPNVYPAYTLNFVYNGNTYNLLVAPIGSTAGFDSGDLETLLSGTIAPGITGAGADSVVVNEIGPAAANLYTEPAIVDNVSSDAIVHYYASSGSFGVMLSAAPTEDIDVSVSLGSVASQCSLSITSSTTLTFTPDNWNTPQSVTFSFSEHTIYEGLVTQVTLSSAGYTTDVVAIQAGS